MFLFKIGKKVGFDSGVFINLGLIIFGLLYLHYIYIYNFTDISIYIKYNLSIIFCEIFLLHFIKKTSGLHKKNFVLNISYTRLLYVIFLLYLIIQIYQVFLTFGMGWGGARIIVFKNILPLTILHDLLQGPTYFFVAYNFARKKYFYFIAIGILCLLSGSKQSLLILILEIHFIGRFFLGKILFSIKKGIIFGLLGLAISILFFYQEDNFFETPLNFLAYRGDIYKFLFIEDLRRFAYDYYNPLTYFLHHTFRLFGEKIYDGPIGTLLFSKFYGTDILETAGGPITPFYVVVDVLFNDPNFIIYIVLGVLVGFLTAKIYNLGIILFSKVNKIFLLIIGYWFMQGWYLFSDPTVFSYRITPVLFLFLVILPIFLLKIIKLIITDKSNVQ
jgi:hypothetical protein